MNPADLLGIERVHLANPAGSKKRLLEEAARLLAAPAAGALSQETIFECLLERERLGSTGLANGFALPHARLANATEAVAAFITLANPVDFDALDGQPVDLVFAMVVPEAATQQHLDLLGGLARRFKDPAFGEALRGLGDAQAVIDHLNSAPADAASGDRQGSLRVPA